jgi:hypothetical protein
VTDERYDEALTHLGIPESSASMNDIEEGYLRMLEVLTLNKAKTENLSDDI